MISLFEMFKIGIGPSSSHTVGPMIAACRFVQLIEQTFDPSAIARISVELFGSLSLTGLGHRTDRAVTMGLCGELPRTIDPLTIDERFAQIAETESLEWLGKYQVAFNIKTDLIFNRTTFLPQHPNGLRCTAFDNRGNELLNREYFSVGGGFVAEAHELQTSEQLSPAPSVEVPFPFTSCESLLAQCHAHRLSISQLVMQNELKHRSQSEIEGGITELWYAMKESIEIGCKTGGILPGGLNIQRRAAEIFRKLTAHPELAVAADPLERMDWVTMFALAVNEQNAAGGRVVTAPTNGAAGVIPAVIGYYEKFYPGASLAGIRDFLLTAAAVGMLYKRNASLSAAEMGCQGEVGVACSMAAAGLAAVMGGTPNQIENAAEIGMEHNLGLTCDPIAGLVQVPCIERNTMGAVKAINAARLAVLYGDGTHRVPLDRVIETMRQTGVDMQSKYKETSLGGLAVNVINC
jgi:L-serine dehydratase